MAPSATTSSATDLRKGRTLVLGLGNEILGDDRVGLLTARRVAEHLGGAVDHAEAAVATIDLIQMMTGYERVVVIDAFVNDEMSPGTIVRADPDQLPSGFGFRSFHTMPFTHALALGATTGADMPEVVVHGMVVTRVSEFTEELSPLVAASWPTWADAIVDEIHADTDS
jgi:hydrogenase maturation protease